MTHPALIERITRSLAYMLRHQPEKFDVEVDAQGWADLEEVVRALNERLGESIVDKDVVDAVESGDRARYEVSDRKIRALYGHSIAIEPGEPDQPPEELFLGIPASDVDRAKRYGLRGGRRRFVHLSLSEADACEAGRRTAREYTILRILAKDAWEDGINFYDRKSLFLAEEIPTHLLEIGETYDDGEPPQRREEGRRDGRRDSRGDSRSRGGQGGRGARGGRGPRRDDNERSEVRERPSEDKKELEPFTATSRSGGGDRERAPREDSSRGSRGGPERSSERSERGDRPDTSDRGANRDRGESGDRGERGGGERPERGGRGERSDRGRSRDRGDREPSRGRGRRDDRGRDERPRSDDRRGPRETPANVAVEEKKPAKSSEPATAFGAGLVDKKPEPKPKPAPKREPKPEPAVQAAPEPEVSEPENDGGGFGAGL